VPEVDDEEKAHQPTLIQKEILTAQSLIEESQAAVSPVVPKTKV